MFNMDDIMDGMNESQYMSKIKKFAEMLTLQSYACELILNNETEEAVAVAQKAKQIWDSINTTNTTVDDILGGEE